MTFARALLLLLLPALANAGPFSRDRDSEPESERSVRDLAYGEVLFHFFQDDHFEALTRLLAGLSRDELPNHARDADLLLGALYLSYGQHRIAGQVFDQILADAVEPELRDRVWYFLARIWHQRGYQDDALAALGRIGAPLDDTLEPERLLLHSQLLMELGRFDESLAILRSWRRPADEWVGFAMYNIGVALVRLGQTSDGAAVLDEVGRLAPENPEIAPLRDKANVALGYAWLQAGSPDAAKPPLQRVRLSGPFSNKALLGIGWAEAEGENYRAALAPWLELRGRNLLDSAVQEAYLAVPYAFASLGADKQAADYYVDAIEAYNSEISRLQRTIESVDEGGLIDAMLDDRQSDGSGWYWRLDDVPDSDASRYLYELMASHRFQEALKSYRDVLQLTGNLDEWAESLSAFDDILDTRQRAYEVRLPVVEESLARTDIDAMNARRLRLEAALLEIEHRADAVALGTPDQQQLWDDLVALEPDLGRLGDADPRAADFRDKQRFLKGLLMWDLERDYRARLWAARRDLRDLDRELKIAARLHHDVTGEAAQWPDEHASLTARIESLRPRVDTLRSMAGDTLIAQREYLEDIAIETLEAQRDRLGTYMLQARFSLAAIYDRATANVSPETGDLVAEAAQ